MHLAMQLYKRELSQLIIVCQSLVQRKGLETAFQPQKTAKKYLPPVSLWQRLR